MVFEYEMNGQIVNYFKEYNGFDEVPVDRRRIDWVFFKSLNRDKFEVVTVELKISDWKRAFKQALYNTYCSHKSYVAIWHKYFKRIDRSLFKEYGIGVLEVNGYVKERIKPEIQLDDITPSMKEILENISFQGNKINEILR